MTSSDEELPSMSPVQDCPMVVRVILVGPLSLIVFSSQDVTSMLVFTCSLIVRPRRSVILIRSQARSSCLQGCCSIRHLVVPASGHRNAGGDRLACIHPPPRTD